MTPDMSWMFPEPEPTPEEIAAQVQAQRAAAERFFPMPPAPNVPPVQASIGDRVAVALSRLPQFQGSGFAGNLLSGLARGYSSGRLFDFQNRKAENERAREEATSHQEANARAALAGREAWTQAQREAGKAHRNERSKLREQMMGKSKDELRPTPKKLLKAGGYPEQMTTSEADRAMRMHYPENYRAPRMSPMGPKSTPEDDRVDAAVAAGQTFSQFAKDLADVDDYALRQAGLSRSVLLRKAGQKLKR